MKRLLISAVSILFTFASCNRDKPISVNIRLNSIELNSSGITLTISNNLNFLISDRENEDLYYTENSDLLPSLYLTNSRGDELTFLREGIAMLEINDKFGKGNVAAITSISTDGAIKSRLYVRFAESQPGVFMTSAVFYNISNKPFETGSYVINRLKLPPNKGNWWSFQGASYNWGLDFVFPLPVNFSRENYMGMNAERYGGGLPLTDVWNEKYGIALSYVGDHPEPVSLPVHSDSTAIVISLEEGSGNIILPGDSLVTVQSAIIVHKGDYFEPLSMYSKIMKKILPEFIKPPELAFQPEWCTWGYRRTFSQKDIMGKVDRLKQLGIKSVIFDDGWSKKHGDWYPDPERFPGGEKGFRDCIKELHNEGFKTWLWWIPGYIDSTANIATEHPEWLIKNKDGSIHRSYGFCPAYQPVTDHYRDLVTKFISDYGIDGFKLDFGVINAAPPCYDSTHHHADPFDSYRSTPRLFETIYKTASALKPDIILEYCACSIPPTIFNLPWVNLFVTSDPNIAQITERTKMYKALIGHDAPVLEEYCGVLGGPTYAYIIGTGGVPGTFTTILDDYHQKWLDIYDKFQLSKGEYINLYDLAFEMPETHVIKKDGKMYYAFYTHPWNSVKKVQRWYRFGNEHDKYVTNPVENEFPVEKFNGQVELRGLEKSKKYQILDYANNRDMGVIDGSNPVLKVNFDNYLLIQASLISE